jgi:hypothetical protein
MNLLQLDRTQQTHAPAGIASITISTGIQQHQVAAVLY